MGRCQDSARSSCPMMSRRGFLAASAAVAAAQGGLMDFASSLFAAEPKPAGRPVVDVVFIRPDKPLIVSWPGGNCDVDAQQALFAKTLTEAAKELDVELRMRAKPMVADADVNAFLEQTAKAPPDGLIVVAMCLFRWKPVNDIVAKRGDIPTIVYSHLSGFTQHLQVGRKTPKTYLGATQDIGWLAFALRMLAATWRMKHTRILVLGKGKKDATVPGLGTVFHPIPKARFAEEFKKVETTDEVRATADFYAKTAKKIVEPSPAEILDAAKNYIVCRRLMEAEGCQGITIACLGWKNPVCMAFSKLLDEGIVAACEADYDASISMLLTHALFERPGFMQDPSPNTVNNTLIGAHCTSATKLEGFHKPYRAPYQLRSYHTRTGVSMQVLWPVGEDVTVMEFSGPGSMILGTGKVVANIPQPPSGCCRTAVEITLDGMADTLDAKGFHQLFIRGKLERSFRAWCKLAGVKAVHI